MQSTKSLRSNDKVNSIINNSLEIIDNKYSIDGWTFPSSRIEQAGQSALFYHNGDHTY